MGLVNDIWLSVYFRGDVMFLFVVLCFIGRVFYYVFFFLLSVDKVLMGFGYSRGSRCRCKEGGGGGFVVMCVMEFVWEWEWEWVGWVVLGGVCLDVVMVSVGGSGLSVVMIVVFSYVLFDMDGN